ncbi:MAG TPA: hypothetical protein VIT65_21175, partial [Microlunatus sp.]
DGSRVSDEEAYGRRWMRDRQNHWWRDLSLQDAGWTYEFFDGSLLMRDDVAFGDGLVQPSGPGYQALIVYQSELDADVAAHLLGWARQGLRLVVVHGTSEVKLLLAGTYVEHERAAARTPGLDGRDGELATTMAELLAQPTVREVDEPAETLAALRSLGVRGRAELVADDRNVLTHLREDGHLLHLYAYHFLYETGEVATVEIALPGHGAAYTIDGWTGALRPHRGVRRDFGTGGERTIVTLTLAPGETALLTLDRSADAVADSQPPVTEIVAELGPWAIAVDSWDAGELQVITEDRGLGYVTREVRPMTAVTRLDAGRGPLRPWRELAQVGPAVSGVGEYTASLVLEAADLAGSGRLLLDLGSTAGGLGAVQIDDGPVRGFDTSRPVVDVTEELQPGVHTVRIRVASSLNNRLLARGYYDRVPDVAVELFGEGGQMQTTVVHDHGLLGPVRLIHELP